MTIDQILEDAGAKMDKSVDYFQSELKGIRTGRASTGLVDYVKVDYYGSPTDIKNLAAVSVPEATQIVIKPFDPAAKGLIMKALEAADLGLNAQADGDAIRVNVPPPSAERRKQLVGQVRKLAEDARVAIRNERRDANKHIDQLAKDKDSHVSEDQAADAKDSVDDLTKKHTARIDELCEKKVGEVEQI